MAYKSKPYWVLSPTVLNPEIQAAMDSFNELWLPKHNLPDNCQLYHYTTLNGMQGILKERALWYGHASSLNDPNEIQYGKKLVEDVLQKSMEKEDRQDLRQFIRILLVYVQAFGKAMFHSFVACFCKSGNLLSQWRGYADKGGGFCIGLEFSSTTRFSSDLESLIGAGFPNLRKVIYDEVEQKELVLSYIKKVTMAAETALDNMKTEQGEDKLNIRGTVLGMQASNILLDMMLAFKHPAFASEEEWRLVRVTSEDHQPEKINFRESAIGLVPYRTTYLYDFHDDKQPEFPLRSIVFGPTLDSVRTHSAIELLLHHIAADKHAILLTPHKVQISGAGYSLR